MILSLIPHTHMWIHSLVGLYGKEIMHATTASSSGLRCLSLNTTDEWTMKRNHINLVLRQPTRWFSQPNSRMACINFAINHSSICSSLAFSAFLGHSCCKMEACFTRQKINVLNSKPEFTIIMNSTLRELSNARYLSATPILLLKNDDDNDDDDTHLYTAVDSSTCLF